MVGTRLAFDEVGYVCIMYVSHTPSDFNEYNVSNQEITSTFLRLILCSRCPQ